ncbi:rhomboid family intramembrane serine protease [Tropicimonas sp. IMCC34043]|uniref:rhomboid family intramembrane serine protease n=1 Tax=Tropicimonas sp. IMCC34043 TaxID=2248760 RepID=UPI000E22A616|nr:rhomboid family intramembrane serine protease [Tropicimonas sp. IMCC34043]
MKAEQHDSPFNALPPVVVALVAVIMGIEIAFQLAHAGFIGGTRGGDDWRVAAIQQYSFSGEILNWMIETGRWTLQNVARSVTYLFVHYNMTHAVFVSVFVLALGKMVGETFSQGAVVAVFFGSGIVGSLAYGLAMNDPHPLVGGYPGAYGLIGAFTYILWVGYAKAGENRYRAFRLIAMLMGIQLLFGLVFGANRDWVAELAGFATGFLLSGVLRPGGWAEILRNLRER